MESITTFLDKAKLARVQTHLNMALFPLLALDGHEPDYLTLEQALELNAVSITEVHESGSVPDLKLINAGKKSVLIVEGEELVGAKQNRIVNSSFLVAGKTELIIPVSCVEQGRWNYTSSDFRHGSRVTHASLRRDYQQDVSASLAQGRGYRTDQGRIWNELAQKANRMQTTSPTGAMADMFETRGNDLEEYHRAFRLVDCQIGAVFAINGQVVGMECFEYQDTFTRFFSKLVKSYALDAIDWAREHDGRKTTPYTVRNFLSAVGKCRSETHRSIGLGDNIRFSSRSVSGVALIEKERVLHLSVFKQNNVTKSNDIGFQRFSNRRNFRTE